MDRRARETAELLDRLRESRWFRHLGAETWGDLTLELERIRLAPGEVLFEQGEPGSALYVLLSGRLVAYLAKDAGEAILAEVSPGETVGEIQVLTGGARTASVRAAEESELVRIPAEVFDEMLRRSPETRREMVAVNQRRLRRSQLAEVLPGLFGPIGEETLEDVLSMGTWRELRRGEVLIEQGDPGDSCFLLISGRLAAVIRDEAEEEHWVGEMGRGELVGEMALLAGERRTTVVRAIRDSRVLEISRESFERIVARYPRVLMSIARTLVQRLSVTTAARPVVPRLAGVRTVAVVPVGAHWSGFAGRLSAALSAFGKTLHLSPERLDRTLGFRASVSGAEDDPAVMRFSAWLDDQELRHRFLVYESEPNPSAWTRKCVRQADLVLLVASDDGAPDTAVWQLLPADEGDDVTGRTMLVLAHAGGGRPRGTGLWLSELGVDRHVHLRRDRPEDVERLARLIAGRAVALALGGGGARAFAHIGVIRALEEAGIEIDAVGGTSLGSMIAAEYAMGWGPEELVARNRKTFVDGKPHRDLTLPFMAVLSGRRARRLLEELFGDVGMEDLWLNCFAVSANLTTADQVIHTRGPVTEALLASMAVPGVVTPVLSGGDLLVDGGLLNNLPGDVARRLWGGRVITVDVSSSSELKVGSAGGALPSARSLLWNRINPLARKIEVPSLFEILLRSSTLASAQNAEAARAEADLYLKPPVSRFNMFGVAELERLVEIGYEHAIEHLGDWEG